MPAYKKTLQDNVINHLRANLLGPTNELDDTVRRELILEAPLRRYHTGVLFPYKHGQKSISSSNIIADIDIDDVGAVTESAVEDNITGDNSVTAALSTSAFYQDSIGITFCVPDSTKSIVVKFGGGHYKVAKTEERIYPVDLISINDFNSVFGEDGIGYQIFDGRIYCDEEYIRIKTKDGEVDDKGFQEQHQLYSRIDKLNIILGERKSTFGWLFDLLGSAYQRHPLTKTEVIDLKQPSEKEIIANEILENEGGNFILERYIKITEYHGRKYIRLQLINKTKKIRSKGENSKELNERCLFQAFIQVTISDHGLFLPYQNIKYDRLAMDDETKEINFMYRRLESYAVGHNTSVNWEKSGSNCSVVRTEWMPSTWSPTVSTSKQITESSGSSIMDLHNLFPEELNGFDKNHMQESLLSFVNHFEQWIEQQELTTIDENHNGVKLRIIGRQKVICDRIKAGIELISQNEQVMKAFRLANLAMHIQMVLGKDERFGVKSRTSLNSPVTETTWKNLESLTGSNIKTEYRPFQLAFLLMAIPGIVHDDDKAEREIVDLIWFPTGGGKTEAYLALTAFTMCLRRMRVEPTTHGGTAVLMRYTLRLLAAQQFERASRLICALEFLRSCEIGKELGEQPISIGLYVGGTSTPNTLKDAGKCIDEICKKSGRNKLSENKFQIERCPWCGTELIETSTDTNKHGFQLRNNLKNKSIRLEIYCIQPKCHFHQTNIYNENGKSLPILVVDEDIYNTPPTLLFGTVDKFAQLAWNADAGKLFGKQNGNNPPELIIQDELHLLSGPLGSTVGLFELVIEELCKNSNGLGPKIIASTATTRNTQAQINALYGDHKKVSIFPASGLNYNDSYFARQLPIEESKRCYLGFMPTGKNGLDAQLQLLTLLFVARLKVWDQENQSHTSVENKDFRLTNAFWTILSYYNSLKDLGISKARIITELLIRIPDLQKRIFPKRGSDSLNFNCERIKSGDGIIELTSRVAGHEIKSNLSQIEEKFELSTEQKNGREYRHSRITIDLVLATSMISVGVDVSRLNLMVMNGMPRTVAEYIQASSRVARETEGLVTLLISPSRARERSHYEHFIEFHQGFYKFVEPLSATPCTEVTLERMLPTLLTSYFRTCIDGMWANDAAPKIIQANFTKHLQDKIEARWILSDQTKEFISGQLKKLSDELIKKANTLDKVLVFRGKGEKETALLQKPDDCQGKSMVEDTPTWMVFNSMREIGAQTWIKLINPSRKN